MKLTREEAQSIVWGDTSDWKTIEENTIGHSRWAIEKEGIFQHLPTKRYYKLDWNEGATEMQDEAPFEYDEGIEAIEVIQKEVTIKQWVRNE